MKTRIRPLVTGLALLAATSTFSAAPPTDMPPGSNPPPMMSPELEPLPPFLHDIVLSEEQRDKIFEILHAQAPGLRAREKELAKALDGLRKLALANEFDDIKAKALGEAVGRAQADVALARARNEHRIYGLLTLEQRKQIGNPHEHGNEPCGNPMRR